MDVQYGKTEGNTQHPVFAIAASDEDLDTIRTTLKKKGIEFEDISEDDDVRFRMIHYQPELCQHPLFVHIEFPAVSYTHLCLRCYRTGFLRLR